MALQERFIIQMTKAERLFREGRKLITKTYPVSNGFAHNTIVFLFHKLKLEIDCHYQRGLSSVDFVRPLAIALLQVNEGRKLLSFTF